MCPCGWVCKQNGIVRLLVPVQVLSLVHTSHRLQQLLQRARSLQIIGKFSIFPPMQCASRWFQQIHSLKCHVRLVMSNR